ncbi:protein-tyrosine phosphatase [Bacillus mesophilus]|uniref:Tyrosine-protein phosphatase n=1 Tax=Bacillus mesophilus TaxID=1808955 RepID=A0A6M0Q561_9BACI|nr:tyrosine-protein phosphatase [Bacillus mesophilus]MBM7660977.1 protein-tyrosine phosphatase [Bacillus mesophilus]NEY71481.1 tyrosine-protein phosphatase [Bacillus mesophilus]
MNKSDIHHIKFETVYNFRDIGGLKTKDGRWIKKGILFRSDDLSRLSPRDFVQLDQLNLQFICDLRTHNERKSKPDRLPQNYAKKIVHVPFHDPSQDYSRLQFMKLLIKDSKSLDFHKLIKDFYSNMATQRTGEIKEVFTQLSLSNNSPALIHCTGGKDRTGFIVALLQLLVGVEYESVIEHYLHSNDLIGPRMRRVERFVQLMSLFRVTPEQIKPLLIVEREYLDEVFHHLFTQYGTIENYLITACGVEKKTLSQLKKLILP